MKKGKLKLKTLGFLFTIFLILSFLYIYNEFFLTTSIFSTSMWDSTERMILLSYAGFYFFLVVDSFFLFSQWNRKFFVSKANKRIIKNWKKHFTRLLIAWVIWHLFYIYFETWFVFIETQLTIYKQLFKSLINSLGAKTNTPVRFIRIIVNTSIFVITLGFVILINTITLIHFINKIVCKCNFFNISFEQKENEKQQPNKTHSESNNHSLVIKSKLKFWNFIITMKVCQVWSKILRNEKKGRFPGVSTI